MYHFLPGSFCAASELFFAIDPNVSNLGGNVPGTGARPPTSHWTAAVPGRRGWDTEDALQHSTAALKKWIIDGQDASGQWASLPTTRPRMWMDGCKVSF